jgi:hypothetical protein
VPIIQASEREPLRTKLKTLAFIAEHQNRIDSRILNHVAIAGKWVIGNLKSKKLAEPLV